MGSNTTRNNPKPTPPSLQTSVDADVYDFGLLLYEMATGTELTTAICDSIPATIPSALRE